MPANPDIYSYFKVSVDLEPQLTGAELVSSSESLTASGRSVPPG